MRPADADDASNVHSRLRDLNAMFLHEERLLRDRNPIKLLLLFLLLSLVLLFLFL